MENSVPPILWYLLWAFVLTVLPILLILVDYRRRMKVLEILKSYAEKGVEPPASVTGMLTSEADGQSRASAKAARDARFGGFIGFTFMASILGAVTWWRFDAGGPQALVYPLAAATVFFGVGAIGFLVIALFTSEK